MNFFSLMRKINNCRVCGYEMPSPPWGEDGKTPSWEICPCCGTEFGYKDCQITAIRNMREKWIANGMNWSDPEEKPEGWSFELQKRNIPDEFL
jgi:hypothetical protein